MKYAVEMVSDAFIHIISLINIDLGIKKLMREGIYRHTDKLEIAQAYFRQVG
jgi:hypothetical protein